MARRAATLKLATDARWGQHLVTDEGRSVYLYVLDEDGVSNCVDACTNNWPPLTVAAGTELAAGEGLDPALVGTIERADGTLQVTYGGHPLYAFRRDTEAGHTRGQRLGDQFFLVSPAGEAVTDEVEAEAVVIPEEEMVVTVSHRGYIKRSPISIYRAQRRGGRGKQGMTTREEDFVEDLFVASTHSYVLIFSSLGKVYWLKVHEIPQIGRVAKGQSITSLINMSGTESIAAILPVKKFEDGQYVVMATKNGVIKKTELMAYSNPRSGGIIATTIDDGDELISVRLTDGKSEIFITTRKGQAIRFKEDEVRPMGRSARGVKAINLKKGDSVVGMEVLNNEASILTVTERGYGKRSPRDDYRVQSRSGSGIITIKVTDKNGPVTGVMQVTDNDDIILVTDGGIVIRSAAKEIPTIGRNTQGVRLISLGKDEKVVTVAKVVEDES